MKRFLFFGLLVIFSLLSASARAQPQALCPEKVLDSGQVEGIFAGLECGGDDCFATIITASGEPVFMLCDEDKEKEFFGKPGNRVSVNYDLIQYWHEGGESCMRTELVKKSRVLAVGVGQDIVRQYEKNRAEE